MGADHVDVYFLNIYSFITKHNKQINIKCTIKYLYLNSCGMFTYYLI